MLMSLSAVAFPLAGAAQAAVPCAQEEVTAILFVSEENTVHDTESSDLVVEARNLAGEACSGALLDYDDNEGGGVRDTCMPDSTIVTNGACDRMTDENGQVTFTRGPRPLGAYRWQVWADQGDDNDHFDEGEPSDAGSYKVADNSPTGINLTPESATNPVGTEHTVEAQVIDAFRLSVSGTAVDFEIIAGPNQDLVAGASDLFCVTDDVGECAITYTDVAMQNGTDQICGYVDTDADQGYDPEAGPEDGGNCDTEGPAGVIFKDTTDIVLKTWEGATSPPACSDGADNDGDGLTDLDDPGCMGDSDDSESPDPAVTQCNDGVDNDDDGQSDLDDPDCSDAGDDSEAGADITTGPCAGMAYGERSAKPSGNGSFVAGSPGNDELEGTDGNDTVCAFAGNDTVDAGSGNDVVLAGAGADVALGGEGNDTLFGGAGKDALLGGLGADEAEGGDGNDIVAGGLGRDSLRGSAGIDTLRGKGGADTLAGGAGPDILKAGGGDDDLMGGPGADQLDGGPGRDTCRSGSGRDEVVRCEG